MPLFLKDGKQVLFVHIPKCAGTSIEHSLTEIADASLLISDRPCPLLPCTPQHSHLEILCEQIPALNEIGSFAIVRHPLLRVISEHQYRNKLRQRRSQQKLEFSKHLQQFFFEYKFDNFIFDNHIRPQVEFVFPGLRVFRLESGLLPALEYAFNCLGQDLPGEDYKKQGRKNVSKYEDFMISGKDIHSVQDFYAADFALLSYKKLDLARGARMKFSEVLKELEDPFENDYCYSERLVAEYQEKKKAVDRSSQVSRIVSAVRYGIKQSYKLPRFLKQTS